jgi:hypothetical protein
MASPSEIELKPGWLEEDVRRARSRLAEWHERNLRPSGLSIRPERSQVDGSVAEETHRRS